MGRCCCYFLHSGGSKDEEVGSGSYSGEALAEGDDGEADCGA